MKDATLGGYIREHERPPAFEGCDGESYTVEIMLDPVSAEGSGAWCAYLFFLRWRDGAPVGHVESGYLSRGASEEEAREAVERMELHEVKALLDRLLSG